MLGLKRKIKVPGTNDYFLIFKKPWTANIGIDPSDKENYIVLKTIDFENYSIVDNNGDTGGFESYLGAEQFLRAYIAVNYSLVPTRWYINNYSRLPGGFLQNNLTGDEVEF